MRLLLLTTFLSTYLFAVISSPLHTRISEIVGDEIQITTIAGAQKGMYGVIIHWFDQTHSVALSWVEIQKIEGETTSLSMIPIHALEQSALPSGTWMPQAGDEVILGYNYQRALLIAPNASIYKKITQQQVDRSWVHPDIFATVLSSRGHPTPLREDFSAACRANNIGIVSFMFDQSVVSLDCQSFKILENKETAFKSDEYQLPFYSRVPHIEANWFGKGSSKLKAYEPYYVELIAENNPENEWIQNYKSKREQAAKEDTETSEGSMDKASQNNKENNGEK